MPACSKQKNPNGDEITFDEKQHSYTSFINGQVIKYLSGTSFIHKFFPQFDPDGSILIRCAEREGITPEEMKKRWKNKGDIAAKFGTKIHETIEDVLRGDMLRNKPGNIRERNTMETATKLANKIKDRAELIGIERIVFDPSIKIAGTMDLYIRSKSTGELWILDHKTNARIDKENKYNEFGLDPIKHISNVNYSHYTLQLNLYENLLKRSGWVNSNETVKKAIFHIHELGVTTYQLDNWQNEINQMILSYQSIT